VDKKLNSFFIQKERKLFYVNICGSYKLSKISPFLAHPVLESCLYRCFAACCQKQCHKNVTIFKYSLRNFSVMTIIETEWQLKIKMKESFKRHCVFVYSFYHFMLFPTIGS